MTLIAYYKGVLLTDQLHVNTDNFKVLDKSLKRKLVVSKCKRVASAISGNSFSDEFNETMIQAIVKGLIKCGGQLSVYARKFDEDEAEETVDAFDGFGSFHQLIMTTTECMSIGRNTTDGPVVARQYKYEEYAGFGLGAAAFMMLARLSIAPDKVTKIISKNDSLVSPTYDWIRQEQLKPFVIIKATSGTK